MTAALDVRCTPACQHATTPGCTCSCEGERHGEAHGLPVQARLPLDGPGVELAGSEERRVAPGPLRVAEGRPAPRVDEPVCVRCGRGEADAGRLLAYAAGPWCRACVRRALELEEG